MYDHLLCLSFPRSKPKEGDSSLKEFLKDRMYQQDHSGEGEHDTNKQYIDIDRGSKGQAWEQRAGKRAANEPTAVYSSHRRPQSERKNTTAPLGISPCSASQASISSSCAA